jgi:hypothetical protein
MKKVKRERIVELGQELIKSGRRQLAQKYHRDHGGSDDEMIAVGQIAELLLKLLAEHERRTRNATPNS